MELLKYFDENYHIITDEYNKLRSYIIRSFPEVNADSLCEEIQNICEFEFSIQLVLGAVSKMDVDFESEKQVNELMGLIIELSNNTPIRENNGFSPNEIFEKYEKDKLMSNAIKEVKIGRNSLCFCGSGKKYKKCCLVKKQ